MGYCNIADLQTGGLPQGFFQGDLAPSPSVQQSVIDQCAAHIDSLIDSNPDITLPFAQPYDPMLVRANIALAIWELISIRGYNPSNPTDVSLRIRYEDTMTWVNKVATARATLVHQKTKENPKGVQPDVLGNAPRGIRNWSGSVGGSGW